MSRRKAARRERDIERTSRHWLWKRHGCGRSGSVQPKATVDIEHDESNRKAVAGFGRMKITWVVGRFSMPSPHRSHSNSIDEHDVRLSLGERSGGHLRSRRHGQSADTPDKARSAPVPETQCSARSLGPVFYQQHPIGFHRARTIPRSGAVRALSLVSALCPFPYEHRDQPLVARWKTMRDLTGYSTN